MVMAPGEGGFMQCPLEEGGESERRLRWVFVFEVGPLAWRPFD